jgi:hypothetical protein
MRSHNDWRKKVAETSLNSDSFVSIISIRSPQPASSFENPKVHPSAAGCAGLDFYERMPFTDPAQKFVDGQRLGMNGRMSTLAAGESQVAIHIPF